MVDQLVKAKIPKKTATELVEYADKQKDKAVNLQWIAIGSLLALIVGGFTLVIMLMFRQEDRINRRLDKIENLIKERHR